MNMVIDHRTFFAHGNRETTTDTMKVGMTADQVPHDTDRYAL